MKARPLRGGRVRTLTVLLGAVLGGAVALSVMGRADRAVPRSTSGPAAPSVPAPARLAPEPAETAADERCLRRWQAVASAPGAAVPAVNQPDLRAQLLGRTKAVPVLFLSSPAASTVDAAAVRLRQELEASPGHQLFGNVVGKVRSSPERARAVFLRDGYLYTEIPELAALYGSLTLSLLFRDPELVIWRGAEVLAARRSNDGDYEYTSGPEQGRRAKLLLFDRVGSRAGTPGAGRHVDLRPLAHELGFDELELMRVTTEALAVRAVYAKARVPTVLHVEDGRARLGCEALGSARSAVLFHRATAARAERVHAQLVSVVKEQVDEGLPFDEPKTEDGQQDGRLRPEWRQAYLRGNSSYEFNGDRYSVFDASGRPRPPQVCIDFVLDTFERAGGTWWRSRDMPRERVLGRLRFEHSAIENRRSVERFVEFARAQPEAFDVYEPPPEARVPLRRREQFFSMLYRERSHYRKGDVVAILGPREDDKLHYHSFFIVDQDPLSGMPTELAGNAGRPRIRSWEGEMGNAPRRTIVARIRPRPLWLESFVRPLTGVSADTAADVPRRPDAVSPAPEPTAG